MSAIEIAKAQDFTIEVRVLEGSGRLGGQAVSVRVAADAAAGATTLVVSPLDDALANGDKLLYGINHVVSLGADAAAGATSLTVSALSAPLRLGDIGRKLRDLTGYTIEFEMLKRGADATPLISKTGGSITIPSQAGADRGKVQVACVSTDTVNIAPGQYYGALWRRNAGSSRPLAEMDVTISAKGFL